MKESTLLEMQNKIKAITSVLQQLINENTQLRDLAVGTLETIKHMPDYNKAIEMNPLDGGQGINPETDRNSDGTFYFARGNTKEHLGDLKGACEDWKKAAELGDEDAAELLKEHCED